MKIYFSLIIIFMLALVLVPVFGFAQEQVTSLGDLAPGVDLENLTPQEAQELLNLFEQASPDLLESFKLIQQAVISGQFEDPSSVEEVSALLNAEPPSAPPTNTGTVAQIPAFSLPSLPSSVNYTSNQSTDQAIFSYRIDFPVDLVWSVDTYTPPEYKGKPLAVKNSIVKVVALTPTENSNLLNFTWLVEDSSSSVQGPDKTGRGANTFNFLAGRMFSNFTHEIKVLASNPITGKTSSASVKIKTAYPEVRLYSNNDGVWGSELGGAVASTPSGSARILAKPYYFNADDLAGLGFEWKFDARRLSSANNPDLLSLSVSENTPVSTRKRIDLKVKNNGVPAGLYEEANIVTNLLITQ